MPTIGDYDEAIRAGRIRFKDQALRAAKPVMNRRKVKDGFIEEPWRAPGSFAVAYKMEMVDTKLRAVRCYFSEHAQHSQRYRVLHSELPNRIKEYTVDFRYLDQGIRADASTSAPFLPVVDMEWVQGRELRQYVAHISDNKDIPRIKALAEAWLTMMQKMRVAQVAHGDLSGNNIMVRDNGALVLIDYDGMYVPQLATMKSNEAGAPEYQHPTAQDRRPYGPEMDRFSALLIYTVLRALQERPGLWRLHSEYAPDGSLASDRMLFSAEDLKAPNTSKLFGELATLQDPQTLKLLVALKQACFADISQTPWVGELADPMSALKAAIASDDDQAIVQAASDSSVTALPAAQSYSARIQAARSNLAGAPALRAALAQRDDDQIAAAWGGMTTTATTRPFAAEADAATKRSTLTKRLREAIRTIDYPAVKQVEDQLRGAPTLQPYATAIQDTYLRYERLAAIKRALDKGDDALATRIFDLANANAQHAIFKQRLAELEPAVRQARERQTALLELRRVLTVGDLNEARRILTEKKLWNQPAAADLVTQYERANAVAERAAAEKIVAEKLAAENAAAEKLAAEHAAAASTAPSATETPTRPNGQNPPGAPEMASENTTSL